MLRVRVFWPNCTYRNETWDGAPVDAFWVEATPREARRAVYPYLRTEKIRESRDLAVQHRHLARTMTGNPVRSACFLVARDLSMIDPLHVHYPIHLMWTQSPFRYMPEVWIGKLEEVRQFASPMEVDPSASSYDRPSLNNYRRFSFVSTHHLPPPHQPTLALNDQG